LILVQEEALMMATDPLQPAAMSAMPPEAQTFEYRGATVRRIQRVALNAGPIKYAWRARVDVGNKGQSVTANSVAEIGDKIDAILDGKK
jgi:hypothetical protein